MRTCGRALGGDATSRDHAADIGRPTTLRCSAGAIARVSAIASAPEESQPKFYVLSHNTADPHNKSKGEDGLINAKSPPMVKVPDGGIFHVLHCR
jgi:hypothetical protein